MKPAAESSQAISAAQANVGPTERWVSLLTGMGLLLTAGRGSTLGRVARAGVAVPLLMRGATGYCAIKAAMQEGSMGEGLKERLRRLGSGVEQARAARPMRTGAKHIDSMTALYESELQELRSAEEQLCGLARQIAPKIRHTPLADRFRQYAAEIETRDADLEGFLARLGVTKREHLDDAMQALLREMRKMAQLPDESVRDAALAASLQRILHYKIAGYGTIAAYAKALGRHEEAAHFHQLAERDQAVDEQLSALAKETLNPQAVHRPQPMEQQSSPEARPH
jgi:ferritin-like metal-binding protein YciE